MTEPLSERAIAAVSLRLASVLVANGYQTNAGQRVFRNRRSVSKTDLPCFVVWLASEEIPETDQNRDAARVKLTITVDSHVSQLQDDNPGRALERIRADAKKAVLSSSSHGLSDVDGFIGTISVTSSTIAAREDGAQSESVSTQFVVTYSEGYGNPYSAQSQFQPN